MRSSIYADTAGFVQLVQEDEIWSSLSGTYVGADYCVFDGRLSNAQAEHAVYQYCDDHRETAHDDDVALSELAIVALQTIPDVGIAMCSTRTRRARRAFDVVGTPISVRVLERRLRRRAREFVRRNRSHPEARTLLRALRSGVPRVGQPVIRRAPRGAVRARRVVRAARPSSASVRGDPEPEPQPDAARGRRC